MAVCHICNGTGQTVHMRSWFAADGFYRVRCGICGGSGQGSYRDYTYATEQAKLRTSASSSTGRDGPVLREGV